MTPGITSPDWALKDNNDSSAQAFSYKDARNYFYQALTTGSQQDRDAFWGKLFQSIGQVIHHVQDMAQPQHVRNDAHVDKKWLLPYYNPSLYESYTRDNREGIKAFFSLPSSEPAYTSDNPGAFKTPRDFWINAQHTGLAKFTNRNFVSAGTNFKIDQGQPVVGATYASPVPGHPQDVPISQLSPPPPQDILTSCGASQGPDCTMSFYASNGPDVVNSRASAVSIFDQYLQLRPVQYSDPIAYQTDRISTLNRYTFDAAHPLLLPKAVGYSAGLINYFFRGKIDFEPDTNNAGKYTIKNFGAEGMAGTFTLYYDAVDGKRYPVAGDAPTETWTNRTIDANQQLNNLSFTPPTSPAPKNPDEYMLVFKGNMGEEKTENGAVGAVLAKFLQPGGATDYVAISMPNPVPYRGVSIGVGEKGTPHPRWQYPTGGYYWTNGIYFSPQALGVQGEEALYAKPAILNITSTTNGVVTIVNSVSFQGTLPTYEALRSGTFSYTQYLQQGNAGMPVYVGGRTNLVVNNVAQNPPILQVFDISSAVAAITAAGDAAYAAQLAEDIAANLAGAKTYVMASDGTVLASEVRNEYTTESGFVGVRYTTAHEDYNNWRDNWSGGSDMWMFDYSTNPATFVYNHKLAFVVPEDCITFGGGTTPIQPPLAYAGTDGLATEWNADWQAGVAAFNLRRKNWFKKNSDEFIAALKTGFAPGTQGVTHTELQTGKLPANWEYQIKRDVDVEYNNYPRDQYNVSVGRHTRRAVQYREAAFSEDVQSDTSDGLTQAGVMVTKREVTLEYQIPVVQLDGTTTTETRNTTVTGYLTQTVTQHNYDDGNGDNGLDFSLKDDYDNWYNPENTTLPLGVPSTITASYIKDRTNSRIGIVLNGTVQNGYNADSLNGIPANPITYALYNPPYPKWSSTIHADTIPDFIATWHKDAKIEYLVDGVGASNALNDSALYGVKQVEITPVGLIANGSGNAPAGTSLGIFSSGEVGSASRNLRDSRVQF